MIFKTNVIIFLEPNHDPPSAPNLAPELVQPRILGKAPGSHLPYPNDQQNCWPCLPSTATSHVLLTTFTAPGPFTISPMAYCSGLPTDVLIPALHTYCSHQPE